MGYKVDNAVIMAAGASSRFAPLSYEKPKALITVNGEVLLERQINQLRQAGVEDIILVLGYMKEQFYYLKDKLGVHIIENKEYDVRNNNSSIYAVREYLRNSYICSSDNYFTVNPFEKEVDDAYYAALYSEGETKEWCMYEGGDSYVNRVEIGGKNAWYMLGHAFWNCDFSESFVRILSEEYHLPETVPLLWEAVYMKHLDELKLKIRKYESDMIFEFDSLDELRSFDKSYVEDTRSQILKRIAGTLVCKESELGEISPIKGESSTEASGFEFICKNKKYAYYYKTGELTQRNG